MELDVAICIYLGRDVDFTREVKIISRDGVEQIAEWNVPELIPAKEELCDLYNSFSLDYAYGIKLKKLRDVRDYILNRASWISEVRGNEDEAERMGIPIVRSWSDSLYLDYLIWKKEYRDLPQSIRREELDLMSLEDINETNVSLFRPCPIDLQLTRLD